MKIQNSSGKNAPQRTCIGCREAKPKRELIRIVITPEGKTEVDTSGRMAGRGAYLCRSTICWEEGLKKGRLERALRRKISAEEQARLAELSTVI